MVDSIKPMLDAAMETLKPELLKLRREGVSFDGRMWVMADVREAVGRQFTINNLAATHGVPVERVTADMAAASLVFVACIRAPVASQAPVADAPLLDESARAFLALRLFRGGQDPAVSIRRPVK